MFIYIWCLFELTLFILIKRKPQVFQGKKTQNLFVNQFFFCYNHYNINYFSTNVNADICCIIKCLAFFSLVTNPISLNFYDSMYIHVLYKSLQHNYMYVPVQNHFVSVRVYKFFATQPTWAFISGKLGNCQNHKVLGLFFICLICFLKM